jgi:hypothetical protein
MSDERDARREIARRWRAGHQAAHARSVAEDRARSIAERVEQTAVLMRSAISLGWQTTDPDEVERVRARFVRLHQLAGRR